MRLRLRAGAASAAVVLTLGAIGCVDRLPDQDLRILAAVPVDRLSASLLWDDYQKDAAAANRRLRGQAIVITGTTPELGSGEPGQRFVRYVLPDKKGAVRANLLDDQAPTILAAAKGAERVTLKCFCEGLAGDVILKSCVSP
jgi:hypothetical protein